MMGVREIGRSLEQWQMGVKDLRKRMVLAPTPRERALLEAQEMVRHVAGDPGPDGISHGGGAGARPAHYRPFDKLRMGRRLRRGRSRSFEFPADWGFPPPLTKRSSRS